MHKTTKQTHILFGFGCHYNINQREGGGWTGGKHICLSPDAITTERIETSGEKKKANSNEGERRIGKRVSRGKT